MAQKSSNQQASSRATRRQAMVKERRNERMQRYQKNKRELLLIKIASIALGILVLGGIGFGVLNWARDRDLSQEPEGVVEYAYSGGHVPGDIDYSAQDGYQGEIPPAGGVHNDTAQQCDVYDQPIRTESAIHSLEHGAVWVTYQPGLPAEQIEQLREHAQGDDYMLMSPLESQPTPIVLTAWNRQLQLQSYDEQQVERFIRSYKNKRGITPEFGASCSGTTMTAP